MTIHWLVRVMHLKVASADSAQLPDASARDSLNSRIRLMSRGRELRGIPSASSSGYGGLPPCWGFPPVRLFPLYIGGYFSYKSFLVKGARIIFTFATSFLIYNLNC